MEQKKKKIVNPRKKNQRTISLERLKFNYNSIENKYLDKLKYNYLIDLITKYNKKIILFAWDGVNHKAL